MKLQERIHLLSHLGEYLGKKEGELPEILQKAHIQNPWFVPLFLDDALQNIATRFLDKAALEAWAAQYHVPDQNLHPVKAGITMAGNIPLVGFHDFLVFFLTGHHLVIKPSSKDEVLIRHIVAKLIEWAPELHSAISFAERLNGCDAYIATGSNNSSRYFEYYFGKYPHIIRKNRTSAAIITGNETPAQLALLGHDLLRYFGLGCRNVSKLFVPQGYDFVPLLQALEGYNWMKDHDKYRNNYDYQLSLLILNKQYYMTNEVVLLVEHPGLFSPITQVHYSYYQEAPGDLMQAHPEELQCLCGSGNLPFGQAQQPTLTDYADGIDTMAFALSLQK